MYVKNVAVVVLVLAVAVVAGVTFGSRGPEPQTTSAKSGVVSVDVVSASPAKYLGSRKVSGTVSSVDEPNKVFLLGCADACAGVAVTFDGELPKPKSNVVVTGVIAKKADGTFRFTASDVQVQ